jgi:hypothetical protein
MTTEKPKKTNANLEFDTDVLNSKIKKLRIELPNYYFNHSLSEESHSFIGRRKVLKKLIALVEDTKNKTGVYLVTGNRGVGKTSLVNQVVNKTSLQPTFPKKWKDKINRVKYLFQETILNRRRNYDKNNRLYLRINFGHKLKDEKDLLRLIARTLSVEYNKYCRSFWRMPFWKVIKGFVFFVFCLSVISVGQQLFKDIGLNITLFTNIKGIFSKIITLLPNSIIKLFDSDFWQLLFLIYFLVYLFCVLLFRTRWFMARIVTHGLIKRQLKKLNSDITYSTERENSINISKEILHIGTIGTGTKTKKSRGVADAREIEMELQDILNNIQHIPRFMSRPNIVIVFDELDKVESGEIGLEKENSDSKASLFSVNATREKQFEISKILSNMKYFLSTANAKFIFIAGREMYDIYLADVSERTNRIGSIFDTVLYVPSFLTDYAETAHSDMTSLTEEFVCRKLIPQKYQEEEHCSLKDYQEYLKKWIYNELESWKNELEIEVYKKEELEESKKILEKIILEKSHLEKQFLEERFLEVFEKNIESKIQEREKEIQEKEKIIQKIRQEIQNIEQKIQKIIAVLQQLIIYLAHVSKGAPKKIIQLFESFIEVSDKDEQSKDLIVQGCNKSKFFLAFDYYKQCALGITAYLITPIFNYLSESTMKEHSDKLLVSSLRFVDFLFKFHKHTFSWKHLDISPEMLEVNRSPELKSIAVDLLKFLTQTHINKSNFSLNDYKFDSLIANEISVMTKTDEVFSALHSFSLDETLPLKEYYKDLLVKTQKQYQNQQNEDFTYTISTLQATLGNLHYYDDELEEAEMYYENAIHPLRNLKPKTKDGDEDIDYETMSIEQLYLFVRNMLKLGMIFEKRKQYDFAYLTYGELCNRIIRERDIAIKKLRAGVVVRKDVDKNYVFVKASEAKALDLERLSMEFPNKDKNFYENFYKEEKKYYDSIEIPDILFETDEIKKEIASPQPLYFKNISPSINDMLFKKMTFEGLRLLYLPFIAKLQILEKSHVGGIARNHLEQLEKEFKTLTFVIDHEEAKLLEAEFFSRVADILYYKNSDLKYKKGKERKGDENKDKWNDDKQKEQPLANDSCTVCYYYHKALSTLLLGEQENTDKDTVDSLLKESIENIKGNRNMKYCTILARILSDWGNVFYSCDKKDEENEKCYIYDAKNCNTSTKENSIDLEPYVDYVESEINDLKIDNIKTKMETAFAMYAISSKAYNKAHLHKRSAYQILKMLHLFKSYEIYNEEHIKILSQKAIRSLWYAAEVLNVFELNKRKKDFDKKTIDEKIPLQYLLVDSEINRIGALIKDLELEMCKKSPDNLPQKLKEYYGLHITSPYNINYSISTRIHQLQLKSKVNHEAFEMFRKIVIQKLGPSFIKKKLKLGKHADISNKDLKNKVRRQEVTLFLLLILQEEKVWNKAKEVFEDYFNFDSLDKPKTMLLIVEKLIAETIFCLKKIVSLSKTTGETHLFSHSFMGSIHNELFLWTRRYEALILLKNGITDETFSELDVQKEDFSILKEVINKSQINKLLEDCLGKEYQRELSCYYENEQALSHYYKSLETHSEGRAYHNMIDKMCYVKDDYNDRFDHFNIANERYEILNKGIKSKIIRGLKLRYSDSKLYRVDDYFHKKDDY